MAEPTDQQKNAALATLGIGTFGVGFLSGFAAMFILAGVLTSDDKKRRTR